MVRKSMRTIAISKFKATCLAEIEKVNKTGEPLTVTRFNKALAQIVPAPLAQDGRKFGRMAGVTRILGDITSPVCDPDDWEANRS